MNPIWEMSYIEVIYIQGWVDSYLLYTYYAFSKRQAFERASRSVEDFSALVYGSFHSWRWSRVRRTGSKHSVSKQDHKLTQKRAYDHSDLINLLNNYGGDPKSRHSNTSSGNQMVYQPSIQMPEQLDFTKNVQKSNGFCNSIPSTVFTPLKYVYKE